MKKSITLGSYTGTRSYTLYYLFLLHVATRYAV
jgi:hypothetical protein